jgi:hypothetical protein
MLLLLLVITVAAKERHVILLLALQGRSVSNGHCKSSDTGMQHNTLRRHTCAAVLNPASQHTRCNKATAQPHLPTSLLSTVKQRSCKQQLHLCLTFFAAASARHCACISCRSRSMSFAVMPALPPAGAVGIVLRLGPSAVACWPSCIQAGSRSQ